MNTCTMDLEYPDDEPPNMGDSNTVVLVQHCYHDRSQEIPHSACSSLPPHLNHIAVEGSVVNSADLLVEGKDCHKRRFPVRLHLILSRLEQDGHGHIISWQPHGRCFVIRNPRDFVSKGILAEYFGLGKVTSLQRQINLYGFKRITQGRDKGGYYHEYFLKGKPYLAFKISRTRVKGTGVKGKPNPREEPDFWKMPWVASTETAVTAGVGNISTASSPSGIMLLDENKPEKDTPKVKKNCIGTGTQNPSAKQERKNDLAQDEHHYDASSPSSSSFKSLFGQQIVLHSDEERRSPLPSRPEDANLSGFFIPVSSSSYESDRSYYNEESAAATAGGGGVEMIDFDSIPPEQLLFIDPSSLSRATTSDIEDPLLHFLFPEEIDSGNFFATTAHVAAV